MASFFVTGTDTGVGKTIASAALLSAGRRRGWTVAALKPVESGVSEGAEGDAALLASAAGMTVNEVGLYRFVEAVAPGVAAERAGVVIDFDRIWERLQAAEAREPDLLLVEGAGGLLVPLGNGRTNADLARELALPLLIVARDALGTINHTLLTVEVAISRGLPVLGIVLSQASKNPLALEENLREIERALGGDPPVLGIVPHLEPRTDPALATAGAPILDQIFGP